MRHLTRFAVAVVVLSACRDNSPLQQNQPSLNALIVDGAHSDGNKDFFFLPPLAANPVGSPNYDAGKFNSHLSPFVEVCELNAVDVASLAGAVCKSDARAFGPARMSLDVGNEQYQLNWDTQGSQLNPARFYRIIVRGSPGGTSLGSLDLDPVTGGMKNPKTGDVYVFQDGRTLPIKVRIEQGAFGSSNSTDRVEQVVPNIIPGGTLDITTNTGFAGARFLNGWLPEGFDQVIVIIERIPVNNDQPATSCLNSGLEELEGCYRFRTDPDFHGLGVEGTDLLFRIPVIAGVCFQIPGVAGTHDAPPFALHRREEVRGVLTGSAEELDDVAAPFLRCDGFEATPPSIGAALRSGHLGEIAKAGWYNVAHAIAGIVTPKSLHAVDLGAGGSTNEFSRFGWARRASMTVISGDGATAPAGSTVQASVRVQDSHHDLTPPVVGQSVTFTVTGGGGAVSTGSCAEGTSCPATTDAQGLATVTWRLGAGTNTLQVSTNHVTNSPVTMTATGTAGQPDLAIDGIVVGPSDLSFADEITYDVTVRNHGTGDAPASIVFLDGPSALSGDDVGGDVLQVPALGPGATATLRSRLPPRLPGTSSVVATVDPNNTVAESNEENNIFTSEPFTVVPKIDFETLGNGTPISTIGLPLALVNDYALQGVAFSFVRFDETPGVASLCNSRAADPTGVTDNHSASIEASGDPCAGWTQGALTMLFARTAGLPTTVQFQLRGINGIDPFPISGLDGAGNALIVTRSNVSTYTSNNGFTARQETVEIRAPAGIVQITMNLPAGTGVVFLDDLVIIR